MKQQRIIGLVISLTASGIPVQSLAVVPVVDSGAIVNLIKNFNQLKKEYDVLQKQYQTSQQQLDQIQRLKQDSEGHYGYGGLLNDSNAFQNREWSPNTWQSTLQGLSGGNPARYQELMKTYQKNHATLSSTDYQKGTNDARSKTYSQDVQVNRAVSVNATYAFNNIKNHLEIIHRLSQKIDQTPNTKAAMDLNARLLTEVAYLQTQALKMQILMNQQMAQITVDTIDEKTASAKFNTLPDE